MKSEAHTVAGYLDELDDDRRAVVAAVREVVLANLPDGYVEELRWGMPTYEVPLDVYPDTYNKQPLAYVSLAAQKRYYSVYLMALYSDSPLERSFRERWAAPSGRALDMGKSCVRFRSLDDLDLALVGDTVAAVSVDRFLEIYERNR